MRRPPLSAISADAVAPARVGRPPRVSVQAIIAAALELGLEQVSLKQIARHLGVAPATLYRHVRNRNELLRLAAFELTLARRLPSGNTEHWSELATRYAETLFESFVAEPQLMNELLKGRLGPQAEIDLLDQFLAAVCQHGFDPEQGVRLFHSIGTLMLGAAAGAIGLQASRDSGPSWSQAVHDALAARDADELPYVRQVFPQTLERQPHHWLPALRALLTGVAALRGEVLPEPSPQQRYAAGRQPADRH
ncbi:TetR/AcrR family transcriptional regulator [Stagnimonas aquatica]|nr:TetR/AcrR family transcriptional regulator [Stagnimonas aquatica]